jgi:hypothetical protein
MLHVYVKEVGVLHDLLMQASSPLCVGLGGGGKC